MIEEDNIQRIDIEKEMKSAYIDYSMSVIVSRALPDVRDGLKPVHRRVLFGMNEMGNTSDHPYKKSANCVGEVMGKYHPHGDSSIYGTVVRLAQPWALRYTLVDGHGNFGNIDGYPAAAQRYTEAKLDKIAMEMLDRMDFLGVNQKELAQRMGCTPQYVSKILKGKENLSLETICKIEDALDMEFQSIPVPAVVSL